MAVLQTKHLLPMNYPDCNEPNKCIFTHRGGSKTIMYSPIYYDRTGKPVGGGANHVEMCIRCDACTKDWISKQTEFDDVCGRLREWREIK